VELSCIIVSRINPASSHEGTHSGVARWRARCRIHGICLKSDLFVEAQKRKRGEAEISKIDNSGSLLKCVWCWLISCWVDLLLAEFYYVHVICTSSGHEATVANVPAVVKNDPFI
jgi:hypothetical protein